MHTLVAMGLVLASASASAEGPIGPYRQPRWTVPRAFTAIPVYVLPRGTPDLEWGLGWSGPLDQLHDERVVESTYAARFGLAAHVELDVGLMLRQDSTAGPFALRSERIGLRWSPWDFGDVFGNPTLDLSWTHLNGRSDILAVEVDLGGALAERWIGALGLAYEHETGGVERRQFSAAVAAQVLLVEAVVGVGLEARVRFADDIDVLGRHDLDVQVGPTLTWRPAGAIAVIVTPLLGWGSTDDDSDPTFEASLIVAWTP